MNKKNNNTDYVCFQEMTINEYVDLLNRKLPRDDWEEIFKKVFTIYPEVDRYLLELAIQEFLCLIYPWHMSELKPLNKKRSIISLLKKLVSIFEDPMKKFLYKPEARLLNKSVLKSYLNLREKAGPNLAYGIDEAYRKPFG